ncbi:MAG: hypothetical protein ABI444_13630 [Candidatus Kapaibacterium sp.]|jgi:hypothetical protein
MTNIRTKIPWLLAVLFLVLAIVFYCQSTKSRPKAHWTRDQPRVKVLDYGKITLLSYHTIPPNLQVVIEYAGIKHPYPLNANTVIRTADQLSAISGVWLYNATDNINDPSVHPLALSHPFTDYYWDDDRMKNDQNQYVNYWIAWSPSTQAIVIMDEDISPNLD